MNIFWLPWLPWLHYGKINKIKNPTTARLSKSFYR